MTNVLSAVRSRVELLLQRFLLVPGLLAGGFVLAAIGCTAIDRSSGELGVGFVGSAEAARTILSTIAGSLITVAGLTFSIMIVTLQLVSQQFTPRALRGFLTDRLNQVVAGTFVGLFLYCLVVLTEVQGTELQSERFVPSLAIGGAVLGAVAALALLLVFIDHMANAIQVSTIASQVARATLKAVPKRYPATIGDPGDVQNASALVAAWTSDGPGRVVRASRAGYLQAVVPDHADAPKGTRVEMVRSPGDFVTEAVPCARVWAPDGELEDAEAAVARWLVVGDERTLGQDVGFGLRQLTDIAVRALSPGVNDPTTAVTCIGYLRAVLEEVGSAREPAPVRSLRRSGTLVARPATLRSLVEASLGEVRQQDNLGTRVVSALEEAEDGTRSAAEAARSTDATI